MPEKNRNVALEILKKERAIKLDTFSKYESRIANKQREIDEMIVSKELIENKLTELDNAIAIIGERI